MNIRLKNALIKEITDTLKTAKKLSMEQLPQAAKELVLFGRITSSIAIMIGSILILTGLYFFINNFMKCDFHSSDLDEFGAKILLGAALSTVGFFVLCLSIEKFICSVFTPKLYILKELRVIK